MILDGVSKPLQKFEFDIPEFCEDSRMGVKLMGQLFELSFFEEQNCDDQAARRN
jgi:hypothetical protein